MTITITDTLAKITSDQDEKAQNQCEVAALVSELDQLEPAIHSVVGPGRFKATSDHLPEQSAEL